jgi:hypothetical protein
MTETPISKINAETIKVPPLTKCPLTFWVSHLSINIKCNQSMPLDPDKMNYLFHQTNLYEKAFSVILQNLRSKVTTNQQKTRTIFVIRNEVNFHKNDLK